MELSTKLDSYLIEYLTYVETERMALEADKNIERIVELLKHLKQIL